MFTVVRRYSGASALMDAMQREQDSVREVLSSIPGFVAYHASRDGDRLTTVTVCETAQATQESTTRAGAWVREHVPGVQVAAPEVSGGEVFIHFRRSDAGDAAQANADLLRAIHAAWNRRDFDYIASLATADCEWSIVPTGQTFRGPDGLREYARGWATAFPDGRTQETHLTAGDAGGVVEFIGRGTHTGPLMSPAGEIPPTGRPLELQFCEVYRLSGGKITGGGIYFDMAGLLHQLGLVPQPAAATT